MSAECEQMEATAKKTNKGSKPLEDHGDKEKETYNKTM
jgi:hypothetical protein